MYFKMMPMSIQALNYVKGDMTLINIVGFDQPYAVRISGENVNNKPPNTL